MGRGSTPGTARIRSRVSSRSSPTKRICQRSRLYEVLAQWIIAHRPHVSCHGFYHFHYQTMKMVTPTPNVKKKDDAATFWRFHFLFHKKWQSFTVSRSVSRGIGRCEAGETTPTSEYPTNPKRWPKLFMDLYILQMLQFFYFYHALLDCDCAS